MSFGGVLFNLLELYYRVSVIFTSFSSWKLVGMWDSLVGHLSLAETPCKRLGEAGCPLSSVEKNQELLVGRITNKQHDYHSTPDHIPLFFSLLSRLGPSTPSPSHSFPFFLLAPIGVCLCARHRARHIRHFSSSQRCSETWSTTIPT